MGWSFFFVFFSLWGKPYYFLIAHIKVLTNAETSFSKVPTDEKKIIAQEFAYAFARIDVLAPLPSARFVP
jgi:hypothetical protein